MSSVGTRQALQHAASFFRTGSVPQCATRAVVTRAGARTPTQKTARRVAARPYMLQQAGIYSASSDVEAARAIPGSGRENGPAVVEWQSLGTAASELRLENTLPTGQSFRWRRIGTNDFIGVIGQRVVRMQQLEDDVLYAVVARGPCASPSQDVEVIHDYFNLTQPLGSLAAAWVAADPHFASLHPHLPGARVLRQDPLECLLSFVCSQNNHISRIQGMVERLCQAYGSTLLPPTSTLPGAVAALGKEGLAAAVGAAAAGVDGVALYAFPTLEQLTAATEEQLREDGFGYRAKYITGSVAALQQKPGGGVAWLLGLRQLPYSEAAAALCELPGVGPKVAACVCLFSLDKHEAIPVDTHVWRIACKHYTPHLRGKSLTKKVHEEVAGAFVDRFGSHAGWAHNTLFIAELASVQDRLPGSTASNKHAAKGRATSLSNAVEAMPSEQCCQSNDDIWDSQQEVEQPSTPPEAAGMGVVGRKRRRMGEAAAGTAR